MFKLWVISTFLLLISASLSSGSFLLLYLYDKEFNLSYNIFLFSSTLLSALLGGYIAYFASKKQISASTNTERLRELKKESASCLIAKTELQTLHDRLNNTKSTTKYTELSVFLEISYLETFRMEFLYLFDAEEIDLFLSVLNRIKLLKFEDSGKIIEESRIQKLADDCNKLLKHFDDLYSSLSSLRISICNTQ